MRSDSDIRRDVEEELRWDPAIEARDITVGVENGIVTLMGHVPSFSQKWEAERAAKRVAGVVAIVNDLEVRLPVLDQRPDNDIARDAVTAIQYTLPDAAEHIKAIVRDGVVTLEGHVEWNHQRQRAEEAVRRVRGIKGVVNGIQLMPKTAPAPVEIKRNIDDALRRSAALYASRITVEADDGTVILTGTERSWRKREEAERIAWSAMGVTKVENRVAVSP